MVTTGHTVIIYFHGIDRGEIPLFSAEENWRARLQDIVNKQMKDLLDV